MNNQQLQQSDMKVGAGEKVALLLRRKKICGEGGKKEGYVKSVQEEEKTFLSNTGTV